jgi:hypothetical protein
MTEDHEPINPTIHAHLTGLGYVHERTETIFTFKDTYHREIEREHDYTNAGLDVSLWADGSIRISGMPDSHTPDLLRFLADALEEESDDQH